MKPTLFKSLFLLLSGLTILVISLAFNIYEEKYFIAFLANSHDVHGHAFVTFGYESDEQQMSVSDGAWGLYPKRDGDIKSVIGTVPGAIKDDFLTNAEVKFIKQVSKSEYEEALAVMKEWQNRDYQFAVNDCVSFIIEVGNTIGLNMPPRQGFDNLPYRYVRRMKEMNQ